MASSLLLVDDDKDLQATLVASFASIGNSDVRSVHNAEEAAEVLRMAPPDLMVLDLGLPGMGGLELIRLVRKKDSALPIIVLSARDDESNRIMALSYGADDYVTKPFSFLELVARINAVMRRGAPNVHHEELVFGELRINLVSREVLLNGEPIPLAVKEFDLLAFLATSPRRAFTKNQLLLHVWGAEPGWQSLSTVKEHVHRLRAKLEPNADSIKHITTMHGLGYRFDPGS
ncbi:MAG: response regulator transcription factor [Actinomycetota bacterium]